MRNIAKKEEFDIDSNDMLQLVKDTVCKGASDNEFKLFVYTCKRLGLDPMARQIYPVKRWDDSLKKQVMTIQTGIDGYRLIAERTGKYAPGKGTSYHYNEENKLVAATAFVKKQTQDGTWHEVEATAHFMEYAAFTKGGALNIFWRTKPHVMLAKCAEALALRRAFPSELSGIYTKEEMEQADNPIVLDEQHEERPECTKEEIAEFIQKHKDQFDANNIYEFAEKRSEYFNKSTNETFAILIQNEEGFIKEITEWLKKHGK